MATSVITTLILTTGIAILVTLSFLKKSKTVLWIGYIVCILEVIGIIVWGLEFSNTIPRF